MSKIPGGPTPMGVAQMRVGAKEGTVGTSQRYHWQKGIDTEQAKTEFPIVPVGPDPYDDIAHMKEQYANARGAGNTDTNWVVPFEQSDAAYLMRKRDQEEKAQFDAWVTQKFDLTDPAQNMMLQQIAPELYQRREEVIDTQQALVSRYAKMRLRGAKNLDDLYLEWLIETNRIDLPKGPIWDPIKWRMAQAGQPGADTTVAATQTRDTAWNNQRYDSGFYSILKWMGKDQAGREANKNNYFDVTGSDQQYFSNRMRYYQNGQDQYYARYPNVYKPTPGLARLPVDATVYSQALSNTPSNR